MCLPRCVLCVYTSTSTRYKYEIPSNQSGLWNMHTHDPECVQINRTETWISEPLDSLGSSWSVHVSADVEDSRRSYTQTDRRLSR